MDDISTRIKDILCNRYYQDSSVDLEDIFNKTGLLDTCRIYTKKTANGEKVTFAVRDLLDIIVHTAWKSDLDTVGKYINLFSEKGPVYRLKSRFDGEKISNGFYHISFGLLRSVWCNKCQPEDLEGIVEFLGSDYAVKVFSKYRSIPFSEIYEAVMGKTEESINKGKNLLDCLDDERVYNIFSDLTMTFPEEVWNLHLGYNNQYKFKILVLAKACQTCDPKGVVEFAEQTKKEWIQYFKECSPR